MIEEWRPIKDYEDWYSVSSMGRVKCTYNFPYKNRGIRLHEGKIIIDFDTIRNTRYVRVGLTNLHTNKRNTYNVHRMMAIAFLPNPENKQHVNHKDGNPHNNILSNLEWSTPSENTKHAWDNDLCARLLGESARNCRYTEDLVYQALNLYYNDLETCATIGKLLNIDSAYIRYIVKGERWGQCYSAFRLSNTLWFDKVSKLLSKRCGNNIDKINKEIYELRKRLA